MTDANQFDTSYSHTPICPHCGDHVDDAWEIEFGGMEETVLIDCDSCGKEYQIQRWVTVRYTTTKTQGEPK